MTVHVKTGSITSGTGGQRHPPPEAYFDTNLVSGLARGQPKAKELLALYSIIDLMHEGRISLVTSPVTKEEINRVPSEHRAPHEAIYAFLGKIPQVDEEQLMPRVIRAGPGLIGPLVVTDEDFAYLQTLLPDHEDARHLFQAIKNGSDYFVTADERTILSRAEAVEARFPSLKIRLPSQLASELNP